MLTSTVEDLLNLYGPTLFRSPVVKGTREQRDEVRTHGQDVLAEELRGQDLNSKDGVWVFHNFNDETSSRRHTGVLHGVRTYRVKGNEDVLWSD